MPASASASRVDAAADKIASSVSGAPAGSNGSGSGQRRDDRGHFRRYWWVYAIAGAAVLGLGIALPLALSESRSGRDIVLPLP